MPPMMPRRGLSVFSASFSPPATEISTSKSAPSPATSAIARAIIRRGTGLIAGSPGGKGRPGRVTVPTPGPALKVTPAPAAPGRTVADTSAPCVTSGSSPASFTMPAVASSHAEPLQWPARKQALRRPATSLRPGPETRRSRNAAQAALAAAAAQVPGGPATAQGRLFGIHAAFYRRGHAMRHPQKVIRMSIERTLSLLAAKNGAA